MPVFERMVMVLEAAAIATDEAKEATKQGFVDAEEKLMSFVGMREEMFGIFDTASQTLSQSEDAVTSSPARSESEDSRTGDSAFTQDGQPEARPPYVTRGSGTPKTQNRTNITPDQEKKEDVSVSGHPPAKPPKRPSKARLTKVKG